MSGETVWWLPRQTGAADAHGNPSVSWPAKEATGSVRIDGAAVAGRVRQDNEPTAAGREAVIEPINVFLPDPYDINPYDRMWVRGQVYELVGEPFLWVHPRTRNVRGLQVTVKRWEG